MEKDKRSSITKLEGAEKEEYTVIVRGKEFKLSYDQIMHDEPNIFSAAFLQDFKESETKVLRFNRSPELFSIIVEHMSGYRVLPLSPIALPPTMTLDTALENLAADALFYGLERLLDILTLPPVPLALSKKYDIDDCVRLTDLATGQLPPQFAWTDAGLVASEGINARANVQSKHVLVFAQDFWFKIDLTCRANGDWRAAHSLSRGPVTLTLEHSHQALFGIEIPPALAGLRTKPLHFRDESQDWVATPVEALAITPLAIDDFQGTFADLGVWAGSFLGPNDLASPHIRSLDAILPGLAEDFRKAGARGQTAVKLASGFWATEMTLVIAPLKAQAEQTLAAKVLNVKLSTGLERRRRTTPACTLSSEFGWTS